MPGLPGASAGKGDKGDRGLSGAPGLPGRVSCEKGFSRPILKEIFKNRLESSELPDLLVCPVPPDSLDPKEMLVCLERLAKVVSQVSRSLETAENFK